MGSKTLPASHIAIPLWPECFCSMKSPIRQKDFLWALCKRGLSTITQVMCGNHLSLASAWGCSMHRAACWGNQVWSHFYTVPRKLCLSLANIVVEFRLPCSHFSCCDFGGGGGVTIWNWDEVKGNKGLWFQRVTMSQLISHVSKAVLRK